MKKLVLSIGVIAVAALTSSCSVTLPLAVSAAPIGNKTGTSSTTVLFGAQLNKNFGISEAAKNGKITGGVATADIKTTSFIIFRKKQIIVTGN